MIFQREGQPLDIYIDGNDDHYRLLTEHVETNGGNVVPRPSPSLITVALRPRGGDVRGDWVMDLVQGGVMLPLDQYVTVDPRVAAQAMALAAVEARHAKPGPRGHNKFTEEKDAYILERVREQPKMRKLLQFYKELAETEVLRGHTGNLIRLRFNHHLAPKLGYVYAQDDAGDIITINGVRQRTEVIPDTHKTMFNAGDDLYLCQEVAEAKKMVPFSGEVGDPDEFYANEVVPRVNQGAPTMMPFAFYGELSAARPNHLQNSWRDHYRKYLTLEAVPYYLAYYHAARGQPKKLPRKDQYELKKINGKRRRETPLDEEIGQTANLDVHAVVDVARVAQFVADHDAVEALRPQLVEVPMLRQIEDENVATEEELTGKRRKTEPLDLDLDLEAQEAVAKTAEEVVKQFHIDLMPIDTQMVALQLLRYLPEEVTVDDLVATEVQPSQLAATALAIVEADNIASELEQAGFTAGYVEHIRLMCSDDRYVIQNYLHWVAPLLCGAQEALDAVVRPDLPHMWTLDEDRELVRKDKRDMTNPETLRFDYLMENAELIDPKIFQ